MHVLVFWDFLKEKSQSAILSRLRRMHFQLKISQVLVWGFLYLQVAKCVCASRVREHLIFKGEVLPHFTMEAASSVF